MDKKKRENVNIYRLLHKLFPLGNHKVLQFIATRMKNVKRRVKKSNTSNAG